MGTPAIMQFQWNEEREQRLRTMRADGISCNVIAAEFGISRNAVIGKLFRLGVPAPAKENCRGGWQINRPRSHGQRCASKSKGQRDAGGGMMSRIRAKKRDAEIVMEEGEVVAIDLPSDQSEFAVSFIERQEKQCAWPLGEPSASMMVCGDSNNSDHSYCPRHRAIAYRAEATRKSRANYEIRGQEIAREQRAAAFLGTR